jgi:hypothetical protein
LRFDNIRDAIHGFITLGEMNMPRVSKPEAERKKDYGRQIPEVRAQTSSAETDQGECSKPEEAAGCSRKAAWHENEVGSAIPRSQIRTRVLAKAAGEALPFSLVSRRRTTKNP